MYHSHQPTGATSCNDPISRLTPIWKRLSPANRWHTPNTVIPQLAVLPADAAGNWRILNAGGGVKMAFTDAG